MAGTNGHSNESKRKPFKRGERERHVELLGENYLLVRKLKAKLKTAQDKLDLVAEDLDEGGYGDPDQGVLPIEDEQDPARA